MANTVDIIFKGVDQASSTIANVNRELDGMGGKAGTTGGKLATLGKAVGALGLG